MVVRHTHRVELGRERVVKTYRQWDRGEPDREWQALQLLDRHAPGLGPRPLERGLRDGRPYVVMTRLPAEPLADQPLTPVQVTALATALRRLHRSIPSAALDHLPMRTWGPAAMLARVQSWSQEYDGPVPPSVEPVLSAARTWLSSASAAGLATVAGTRVFTNADGNLDNLLWDGTAFRVVDFEDSGVSDLAYEVADLVEHLSVWLPGRAEAATLVPLLGLTHEDLGRLAPARVLMATFWLLMLLPGSPAAGRNPVGTLERQSERVSTLLGCSTP